jgi:hypothetical protein
VYYKECRFNEVERLRKGVRFLPPNYVLGDGGEGANDCRYFHNGGVHALQSRGMILMQNQIIVQQASALASIVEVLRSRRLSLEMRGRVPGKCERSRLRPSSFVVTKSMFPGRKSGILT